MYNFKKNPGRNPGLPLKVEYRQEREENAGKGIREEWKGVGDMVPSCVTRTRYR